MLFVNPLVQVPVAPVMFTVDGPVIVKSEPLAATELHCTGPLRLTRIVVGEQATAAIAVIGVAGVTGMVNVAVLPAGNDRRQFAINVLPSMPVFTCNVNVPSALMGAANVTVTSVTSAAALQTGLAPITVTGTGPVIVNSDPFAVTDEHKIGSGKRIVTDDGAHKVFVIVPIGTGGCACMINGAASPAVNVLKQEPISVLPSLPAAATTL